MYLVAYCLFGKFNNKFKEVLWKGIYMDDELLVFKVNKLLLEVKYVGMTSKVR